jgi:signal transduction histidine kinase
MVAALSQSRGETETHISALKETNAILAQTRKEMIQREKMVSTGKLAAGLAHELGNPLAALIGYLEFLKGQIVHENQMDIVERSLAETARIDFLVRELLNFSRPDRHLEIEDVDLVTELRLVVDLLQHQGNLKLVSVIDQLPETDIAIQMNRNKLQQVLINILLNAGFACGDDGRIVLSAGNSAAEVWVKIADNGCGISGDNLERIFDPFYTTKDTGQGTGLGLSVCQRIIDEAGGRIDVESIRGIGTSFILRWIPA